MNVDNLPAQQRSKEGIELRPTIRNFRIVGSWRSWQFIAGSHHFVDVNKMVNLGLGSRSEVGDATV